MFTSTLSTAAITTLAGIAGGTLAVGFIFGIAFYVLLVIAIWKMFNKFGEPGYKALIPIYNFYIVYKYTWKGCYFWVFLAACFFMGITDPSPVGSTTLQSPEYAATSFLSAVFFIAAGVIDIISSYKLSKAFGHGVGYFIGLVFLPNIFYLILGFGKSEYVGKPCVFHKS